MADSSSTLSAIAGAVPVVGSVISGVLNNASNSANNQKNRDFTEQLYQQQKGDALTQWNLQNAYNSPAAQMARYKAAGLNPNLIYGSATNNVAQPAVLPHPSAPQSVANHVPDFGQAAAQGLATYNSLQLGQAQTNNFQAQTTLAMQDAFSKGVDTAMALAGFSNVQAKTQSETALNLVNSDKAIADTNATNVDTGIKSMLAPYQADLLKAGVNKDIAETTSTLDSNQRAAALQAPNLAAAVQAVMNLKTQNLKDNAEIDEINRRTTNLISTGDLQSMDVKMRERGVMPGDGLWTQLLKKITGGLFSTAGQAPEPTPYQLQK